MITSEQLNQALSYDGYNELSKSLFEIGKTTGDAPNVNTELYLHYTKMNILRTSRVEKKVKLTDDIKTALSAITEPQHWIILVESWCGDVPHSLPIIHKMSAYQPLVNLYILLRDKNLEVMDNYLTKGGRSIPKLVAFDDTLTNELFTWGPRSKTLQQQVDELKSKGVPYAEITEMSQRWYNKNNGEEIQREVLHLLTSN